MNVLIFGGSGFLGSEITELLKQKNINCYSASSNNLNSDYKIDISKIGSFDKLPKNFFNIIINCATILPGKDFLDKENLDNTYKTNILGTQNICNWIKKQSSVDKIVNCSTLVVNSKPWKISITENEESYCHGNHIVYSNSKLFQELLFKTFSEKYSIDLAQVRFSALYGNKMPKVGLLWNLINEIKTTNKIKIKNSKNVSVDFLNVIDASKIILNIINNKKALGIINGASGVETSIYDLGNIIKNIFNNNNKPVLYNKEDQNYTVDRSKVSVDKLKEIIDVSKFISIDEGIKKLLDHNEIKY
ncbi:MAG: NAD(P)-dependent oxidoreductase [Flavobacteriaceae bacterium]|jgi:nucleoside-diphosphate-sugar epimerase|nr:NAD(P)-dependent oxidoreductase [Flavobacteriaceae bacterium]